MSLMMIFVLTACGNSDAANDNKKAAQSTEETKSVEQKPANKILVAYFSATGNTKRLAETMADVLQADIYEIKPKNPYTSEDLNYHDETTRATVEQKNDSARPEIDGKIDNFNQYEKIVIAYPIWWGQEPRIMDTFIESYDFSGKTIIPICTSGGSDIGASANSLKTLCSQSAIWKDGKMFSPAASKEELQNWLNSL